ncbi:TPA: WG repeat-containing protein, partial [Campylobacter coli]|nr:WG repeat-containing protein [Campylobacter coli]
WGFIDKNGEFAIKPNFDDAWYFREGLAKVGLNGKYGLIDKSGKIVIEPIFDDIDY